MGIGENYLGPSRSRAAREEMQTTRLKQLVLRSLLAAGLLLSDMAPAVTIDIPVDADNNTTSGCMTTTPVGADLSVSAIVNVGGAPPLGRGDTSPNGASGGAP